MLIAHLDTGYDPGHKAAPVNVQTALEHNFTDEGKPDSARRDDARVVPQFEIWRD